MLQYNYNAIHTILNAMCKLPRGPSSIADDTCDNYNTYNSQHNGQGAKRAELDR